MGQLALPIEHPVEPDRNFRFGGRSFYFFDFDDNIAFLSTPTFLFHFETGHEIQLTSKEFAEQSRFIGKSGVYADYRIDFSEGGTFRNFRDKHLSEAEKILGQRQPFVEDLAAALGFPDFHWQGPSWSCFYHAVHNGRPLSLITARGHSSETLKEGIQLLVEARQLPREPNYLSLFPVSHPVVKKHLKAKEDSIPELKRAAIRASVSAAVEKYGPSPYHRFGMSDDDPANVQMIIEEMARLKGEYPDMSFFVIDTHKGKFVKREIYRDFTVDSCVSSSTQLELF